MDEHVTSAVEDEAVLKARALLYRRFKVSTRNGTCIILVDVILESAAVAQLSE